MDYLQLPVSKEMYDLLLWVYKHMPYMSRQYRYTLGERMKEAVQRALAAVYKSSISKDRLVYVREARVLTADMRVYVHLMRDLHLLQQKQLLFLLDKVGSISKQLLSWEKYFISRQNEKKDGKYNIKKSAKKKSNASDSEFFRWLLS